MHYVCLGIAGAVAVHRGFACTREELPTELQRVCGNDVGKVMRIETYSSRAAADAVAAMYDEALRNGKRELTARGTIHRGPIVGY